MALIDRIGVDVGRKLKLEDAIEWAARNQVRHIDIQLDTGENKVTMFDDARCRAIVASARANGVTIALHTLSAVNVGEYSPFLSEAVDAYMRAYIEVAPKLAAEWIVVHAGYHFTAMGMRNIWCPAKAISISAICFASSKRAASRGITPMPLGRLKNCNGRAAIWWKRPAPLG
jgi:hypothetical protein